VAIVTGLKYLLRIWCNDPGFLYTFMYLLYRIIVDLCS